MKNKLFKTMLPVILLVSLAAAILSGCGSDNSQQAQNQANYPEKPIQVIVPYGAGGDTDVNARILAKYLSEELGQKVIVSNVTGAAGSVGSTKVKEADPDGYTVLFNNSAMLCNNLLGLVDYTFADFENGGLAFIDNANVFVVSAKSKYQNLNDVITEAKANPGKVKFATSIGAPTHIQILAFQEATGTALNIVDVGGAADKTAALLGGQIDIIGTQYGVIKEYIDSGDFRCIGVLADERSPLMPDVPTFKEQGVDLTFDKLYFYLFPPKTPEEVVTTFTSALKNVVNSEEYKKEAAKMCITPYYMSPEDATERIKENDQMFKKYQDFVKE